MYSRRVKPAFTLIEILVAIGIMAVVVAVLLPAIQGARESARRMHCGANLKQIGIALHSYESTQGCWPASVTFGYSAHAMLLPHLGLQPIYNAINFSIVYPNTKTSINATVSRSPVDLFLCPSDLSPPPGGWTNFAVSTGSGVARYGWNGCFQTPALGMIKPTSIKDGTSSTIMLSEWVRGPGNATDPIDRQRHVFRLFPAMFSDAEFDRFVAKCAAVPTKGAFIASDEKGLNWIQSGFVYTWYNHVLTPNQNSCQNEIEYQYGAIGASSRHRKGVNVLLADGSTRFVSESVDLSVWRALASRDGGEQIEQF